MIFDNPMSGLETWWSDGNQPPVCIDLDDVRNALNSSDPARALIAALAAYHGLRSGQLSALQLTDLRDRQLHIDERVIPLADDVRRSVRAWLDHRAARWPTTTNPHLFVHFRTATRTDPVGRRWIKLILDLPGGVQALRQDRILYEAIATAATPDGFATCSA